MPTWKTFFPGPLAQGGGPYGFFRHHGATPGKKGGGKGGGRGVNTKRGHVVNHGGGGRGGGGKRGFFFGRGGQTLLPDGGPGPQTGWVPPHKRVRPLDHEHSKKFLPCSKNPCSGGFGWDDPPKQKGRNPLAPGFFLPGTGGGIPTSPWRCALFFYRGAPRGESAERGLEYFPHTPPRGDRMGGKKSPLGGGGGGGPNRVARRGLGFY